MRRSRRRLPLQSGSFHVGGGDPAANGGEARCHNQNRRRGRVIVFSFWEVEEDTRWKTKWGQLDPNPPALGWRGESTDETKFQVPEL